MSNTSANTSGYSLRSDKQTSNKIPSASKIIRYKIMVITAGNINIYRTNLLLTSRDSMVVDVLVNKYLHSANNQLNSLSSNLGFDELQSHLVRC